MAVLKKSAPVSKPTTTTAKAATTGGSDFENKFKAVQEANPQGNKSFKSLPIGKFEALATEGGKLEKDGRWSAWIDFTLTEGEAEGQKGRSFFFVENDEGDIQVGASILHRMLAQMGYVDADEPFHSKDHIEELLAEIAINPCWVVIKVAVKAGYTNIYLDKVMENQDEKPTIE